MSKVLRRFAIGVLSILVLGIAPFGWSQSNNASIDGQITDPGGAVVQGAQVVLTSKDTKQTTNFVSDDNGYYSFRNVLDRAVRDLFAAASDWSVASAAHEKQNRKIAEQTAADSLQIVSHNLSPLLSQISTRSDVKRLKVAPDGMLSLLPFGAPTTKGGTYLVEHLAISYLASSRDLIAHSTSSPIAGGSHELIVAVSPGGQETNPQSPVASAFRSETLQRLSDATIEAREIKRWNSKRGTARRRPGDRGTNKAVTSAGASPHCWTWPGEGQRELSD
jgi:hypothetical protein